MTPRETTERDLSNFAQDRHVTPALDRKRSTPSPDEAKGGIRDPTTRRISRLLGRGAPGFPPHSVHWMPMSSPLPIGRQLPDVVLACRLSQSRRHRKQPHE